MMADVDQGITWALEHLTEYGGDPNRVVLMGQSAGAHLASLLLLEKSRIEAMQDPEVGLTLQTEAKPTSSSNSSSWPVSSLRGFVGISGPYDLPSLGEHLEQRGVNSLLLQYMCPAGDIHRYSPTLLVQSPDWPAAASDRLPKMLLFHGTEDKTVPVSSSQAFHDALEGAGARVTSSITPGLAHAEVIVEGPMRGEDHQIELLLPLLYDDHEDVRAAMPMLKPMWPTTIIKIASFFMPF